MIGLAANRPAQLILQSRQRHNEGGVDIRDAREFQHKLRQQACQVYDWLCCIAECALPSSLRVHVSPGDGGAGPGTCGVRAVLTAADTSCMLELNVQSADGLPVPQQVSSQPSVFQLVYEGPKTAFSAQKLQPGTEYRFRVQAFLTVPAAPGAPPQLPDPPPRPVDLARLSSGADSRSDAGPHGAAAGASAGASAGMVLPHWARSDSF